VAIIATLSTGPKLGKTDKGVHIIRLSAEAEYAEAIGKSPSEEQLLSEAAKHVGAPSKTDIVVYDHKPFHVVNGELRPHPQVHDEDKDTILNLSFKDQDKAVWWSEQAFRITRINRSPDRKVVAGSPEYPFNLAPPYDAQTERDEHGRAIFVVRATPIVKTSIGQMYKISFFMEKEDIDPDMFCGG
jgi:hypothetical protein